MITKCLSVTTNSVLSPADPDNLVLNERCQAPWPGYIGITKIGLGFCHCMLTVPFIFTIPLTAIFLALLKLKKFTDCIHSLGAVMRGLDYPILCDP